jgi:hypothetical protein
MPTIRRCRHEEGDRHNCKYVDQINSFIDKAERLANEKFPKPLESDMTMHWRNAWDRAYLRAMDELTVEAGLRSKLFGRNGVPVVPVKIGWR